MFIKNASLRNRLLMSPADLGGFGGGQPPQQNVQENGTVSQNQEQNAGQNSNENTVENFSDLWDNSNENDSGTSDNNPNPAPEDQQPAKSFDEIMKQMSFATNMTQERANKLAEGLRNGDFTELDSFAQDLGRDVMAQTLRAANGMIKRGVDQAVRNAVTQSQQNYNTQTTIQKMHDRLPMTTDPALAPIAQATMGQLMKKNKGDVEKSLSQLEGFFKHMQKQTSTLSNNRPGDRRFGGSDANSGTSDETDWVKLLNG